MCPLRGQSLESRLAAQPSVERPWGLRRTDLRGDRPQAHQIARLAGGAVRQPRARNSSQSATGSRERQVTSSGRPIRVVRPSLQAQSPVPPCGWPARDHARVCVTCPSVKRVRPFASASQRPWASEACPNPSPRPSALSPGTTASRKRSMIEAMRVLLKRGVASNKGMNPTRSTQTAVGPRGLFRCWAGVGNRSMRQIGVRMAHGR